MGIPLYSDAPEIHDYVVQANGAFVDTINGIYNLAELGQTIELRVVLHRPSVARLRELAYFIFNNLPFVSHVALMGVEPIGFAPINRDSLWIDPADFSEVLEDSVLYLASKGIAVSLYNLPLCTTPRTLWKYYRKSISDWKNTYLPACTGCAARRYCGGFFASTRQQWVSPNVRPINATDLPQGYRGEE